MQFLHTFLIFQLVTIAFLDWNQFEISHNLALGVLLEMLNHLRIVLVHPKVGENSLLIINSLSVKLISFYSLQINLELFDINFYNNTSEAQNLSKIKILLMRSAISVQSFAFRIST